MPERPLFLRPAPMREFDVGERRASWLELFFDLCFVAAIAALGEELLHDLTLSGVVRFLLLFVPVWWAWMEFTWYATAWDNDDPLFRVSFLGAMFLILVLAGTIPDVHRGGSASFALVYAAMQGVVALLFVKVLPHAADARRLVRTYLVGDVIGGLAFLASVFVEPPARWWAWVAGMLALLVWPVFAVRAYPGQPFDSRHIPERYGLFTIIVLGESVVAVAAGIAQEDIAGDAALTGVLGFGIAAAFWWTYFETVTTDPLSRERVAAVFVWGYGHFLAFAGIVMTAVGVRSAIAAAASDEPLNAVARWIVPAGPALFVLALGSIHAAGIRRWDAVLTGRVIQLTAFALLGAFGAGLGPEGVSAVVLLIVAGGSAFDVRHARRSPATTGLVETRTSEPDGSREGAPDPSGRGAP